MDDERVLVLVPVLEEDRMELRGGGVVEPVAAREQELDLRVAGLLAVERQRVRAVVHVGRDVEARVRARREHDLAAVQLEPHAALGRLDVLLLDVEVRRRLLAEELGAALEVERHLEGEGAVGMAQLPGRDGALQAVLRKVCKSCGLL